MPRPDEYSESLRMRLFVCHFCCISCMAAICNFVRRFPHIQIHIDYDDVWKTRLLDIWIWSKKKWLQSYECVLGVAVVAWTWSSFCYLFSCSPPHVERINMPKLLVHSLDILESLSQCISYPKSRLQALKWGTTWLFSNIFDLTAPYLAPTCRLLKIYSSKDSSNKKSLEIQTFTAWISGQFSGFPSWHFLFLFGSVLVVF